MSTSTAIGERGATYDTCEGCGTEAQPYSVNGAPGTDQHNWSIFVCGDADKSKDGCGRNWSRTTARGKAHNDAKGTRTAQLTPEAAANRTSFTGTTSPAYRASYDLIFAKGDAAQLTREEREALLLQQLRARLGVTPN